MHGHVLILQLNLGRLQLSGGHLTLVTALCSSASVFTRSASRARLSRILRGRGVAHITTFTLQQKLDCLTGSEQCTSVQSGNAD